MDLYGTRVCLLYSRDGSSGNISPVSPEWYMEKLWRCVESYKLSVAEVELLKTFPEISNTLQSVLDAIPYLGEHQLAMSNGGYGDSKPIYAYVGIVLKKDNSLAMKAFREEETAIRKTQEAVEFIYSNTMNSKIKKGAKKLSPEDKQDFEQEVEEFRKGLDSKNFAERVSYLEELYKDLIA